MKKRRSVNKNDRPRTGVDVLSVRWRESELAAIDAWRKKQSDFPSRSQTIRRLVQIGLGVPQPVRSGRASQRVLSQSADLAGRTIDVLADQSAPAEDRAKRKRRLLKGPEEFREMRDDLPKGQGRR